MRNIYDTMYLRFGNESAKTNAWLLEKEDYQTRLQRLSCGLSSNLNGASWPEGAGCTGRYIQNNRGSIQCLLAPTPGCSPCCRSICIPVVVAGKGLFWWPWTDCSSRNFRIVSAWTSSCLSRSLIYHNLMVNCQQTIHGDIDICTVRADWSEGDSRGCFYRKGSG